MEGDGTQADLELVRAVEAQTTQWLISHLLAVGMTLVAGGAVAAVRMARGRGAALTASGAGVMAVGCFLMSLRDLAHGVLAYALVGRVDRDVTADPGGVLLRPSGRGHVLRRHAAAAGRRRA